MIALVLLLVLQVPPGAADSLTLTGAIELGRSRAVAVTLAGLGARVAEARAGQRRAEVLPNVSFGGTTSWQTKNLDEFGLPFAKGVTDPFSVFVFQLRASQTVLDPAAFARLRAAKDSVVAAGLDVETAGLLAGTTAGIAFLRAVSAEETVVAREADSVVAARLLQGSREALQAGVIPAIDLTRSEVHVASVRAQLAMARNQRARTRLDLLRTVDLPPDTVLVLSRSLDEATAGLPADAAAAVRFGLDHRSDLRAERQRLAVLERGRAAIRAEHLPSVVASGAYSESGKEAGHLKGTYAVQLGLTVPILDGFRRQLRSREQGLRIEAQALRVRDLERQIDTDARQALLDLASAREQAALAAERGTLAERELRQVEERFKAGVAGSLETVTAQGGLVTARDAMIQGRVGLALARVNALRALGVLDQMRNQR